MLQTFFAGALVAVLASSVPAGSVAGPVSLLGDSVFGGSKGALLQAAPKPAPTDARRPFIAVSAPAVDVGATRRGSSLFAGQEGLFAPLPQHGADPGNGGTGGGFAPLDPNASYIERLRHLIGHAESRRDGYDAINYGARRLPARRPTEMTLGEIYAWIAATPGQPHAIGRYQFIPSTLKRLARQIGAAPDERFSPRLQDRLADELFAEAGLAAFRDGVMGHRQFMNNLAKIWAGLPNSSGRSHYHGYAGNRATMTWASFESEIVRIFQG
jgi:hypothetical protein